jgi:cytochrome c oxidase subunit II
MSRCIVRGKHTSHHYFGLVCLLAIMTVIIIALSACGGTSNATPTGGAGSATAVASPSATGGTSGGTTQGLIAQGDQLSQQLGCRGCHSIDGTRAIGPTWKGLFMSQVTLTDGSTVTADDAYLKESITQPDAKIVQSYKAGVMSAAIQGVMGQISQDDNLNALVEYIKSLK